ncbi:hypothetical protein [Streptomyces canus]|uniref:hypothetical protein n=1 Tax=Streptomyces canus TaxID=58343 RepID=UPI003CFA46B7
MEQSPDLPHLIARVSELVLRLGYDPEDLVTLPRAELDRRETAAYSAGWADVVAEQLPAIRRAYEERITAAYLQGQEDARTGRRPRRARRAEGEPGAEVIQLPYVQLLRPPSEVTRVEERGERERSVADGTPVPVTVPPQGSRGNAAAQPAGERQENDGYGARDGRGRDVHDRRDGEARDARDRRDGDRRDGDRREGDGRDRRDGDGRGGRGGAADESAGPSGESSGEFLLSAREVREKRSAPAERRPVVRRNGRPSVPPLDRPGDTGAAGRDRGRRTEAAERSAQDPAEPSGAGGDESRRLSDRARALADELEGRAGGRRRDEQPGAPGSR